VEPPTVVGMCPVVLVEWCVLLKLVPVLTVHTLSVQQCVGSNVDIGRDVSWRAP
jgi:hypothetical protein